MGSQVEHLDPWGPRGSGVSAHQEPWRLVVRPTSDILGSSTHSTMSHSALHSLPATGAAQYPKDKSQQGPRAWVNIMFPFTIINIKTIKWRERVVTKAKKLYQTPGARRQPRADWET